jgi:hypothetical protein
MMKASKQRKLRGVLTQ